MIRIAVICLAPQRLADQIVLAEAMRERGGFEFRFLCTRMIPPAAAARIAAAGFPGSLLTPEGIRPLPAAGPAAPAGAVHHPQPLAWRTLLRTALQWSSLSQILLARRMLRVLRGLESACERAFAEFRPHAVFVFGDRHGDLEAAAAKVARAAGIPIVIPYIAYSDIDSLVRQRSGNPLYHDPAFSPLLFKRVHRKYPGQYQGGTAYYMPFQILALDRFGALPSNPWTFGCGLSDIVCVDSAQTVMRYSSYGVPLAKLKVVGDIAYDRLHGRFASRASLRADLITRYHLASAGKIVMVALPQLAEHGLLPWDAHFEDIDFLLSSLSASGAGVLVSLHPKMDRARYAPLEARHGCRILEERLFDVLPAADAFVSTYSSTFIWSVLCGVPPVVVDFRGLDMPMADFLSSARVIKQREAFPPAIAGALSGTADFSADWKALSRDQVFDGRTVERYCDLVRGLAGKVAI